MHLAIVVLQFLWNFLSLITSLKSSVLVCKVLEL